MESKTSYFLFSISLFFISCAFIAFLLDLWIPRPLLFWIILAAIVGGYRLWTLFQWKPFIPEHKLYSLTYPSWWVIGRKERYRIFFSPFFSKSKIEVQIITKSNAKIPGNISTRLGIMNKGYKKYGSKITRQNGQTLLTYHQDSWSLDKLQADPIPIRTYHWYIGGHNSIVAVSYQVPKKYVSKSLARQELQDVKKMVGSVKIS